MIRERIAVAMSGGVDSSVVAATLVRAGHDVVGMTLRMQRRRGGEDADVHASASAIADAQAVARELGIAHHVIDCQDEFEREVLSPCWSAYNEGRTPNPCVLCNPRIKFGLLWREAARLSAVRLATGHYARIERPEGAGPQLWRGLDRNKDQSYFLCAVNAEQLSRAVFPLGAMTKPAVRELAQSLGLPVAERKESQDACVATAEVGLAEFLRAHFGVAGRPGEIVDSRGRQVGSHQGIHLFTVGQRRGLGVQLGVRAFVCALDGEHARVTVSSNEADLLSAGLIARDLTVLAQELPQTCDVQIRYRHQAAPARVTTLPGGRVQALFASPQRAVTPGQAAVFYDGDRVLAGSTIEQALPIEGAG